MSAPEMVPLVALSAAVPRDDRIAMEALLGRRTVSAERVGNGRNSRVYRVCCDKEEYIAKFYFGTTADGRDRLEVEFSALQFLWVRGVRCVPQPIRADHVRKVALYSFVTGEPVDVSRASADDVEELLSFVGILRRMASEPEARILSSAAEAFFTSADLVANIRARLKRLQAHEPNGPAYKELRLFLGEVFSPAFDRFAARAEAARFGELELRYRTLSPSDLGFHNALRTSDGGLVFLDFEYFGWDDPAKTLSDLMLHPKMDLSPDLRRHLAGGFREIFASDPDWHRRVELLFPLFSLKWCMILLNEFRTEQIARRRYVDLTREEVEVIHMRQLGAARALLERTVREPDFPYWGQDA
jgi:hypothetical protein